MVHNPHAGTPMSVPITFRAGPLKYIQMAKKTHATYYVCTQKAQPSNGQTIDAPLPTSLPTPRKRNNTHADVQGAAAPRGHKHLAPSANPNPSLTTVPTPPRPRHRSSSASATVAAAACRDAYS